LHGLLQLVGAAGKIGEISGAVRTGDGEVLRPLTRFVAFVEKASMRWTWKL
jgi:hypothetical protein